MEKKKENINLLNLGLLSGIVAAFGYICGAVTERCKAKKVIDLADTYIELLKERVRRLSLKLDNLEESETMKEE